MKALIIAFISILYTNLLFAQEYTGWNVSLNLTPSFSGLLIAPAINKNIGNRMEISLMPVIRYYKKTYPDNTGFEELYYGALIGSKYYLYRENMMDPYVTLNIGYGGTKYISRRNDVRYDNYYNVGIIIGNEINIGQKGWNFDFNIGLLGSWEIPNSPSYNYYPIFSVGVKKRFLVK